MLCLGTSARYLSHAAVQFPAPHQNQVVSMRFVSGNLHGATSDLLELNGQRYFISKDHQEINWNEAWSYCKKYYAKLVRIESKELQQKLETELPKHRNFHYWTAGYWNQQKQMSFTWNNGKTFSLFHLRCSV